MKITLISIILFVHIFASIIIIVLKFMSTIGKTHPWTVMRAAELNKWRLSGEYERIINNSQEYYIITDGKMTFFQTVYMTGLNTVIYIQRRVWIDKFQKIYSCSYFLF